FSSRSRHTRSYGDWSSDVCSSDLAPSPALRARRRGGSTVAPAPPAARSPARVPPPPPPPPPPARRPTRRRWRGGRQPRASRGSSERHAEREIGRVRGHPARARQEGVSEVHANRAARH